MPEKGASQSSNFGFACNFKLWPFGTAQDPSPFFQLSGNLLVQSAADAQPPIIALAIPIEESGFGLFARLPRGAQSMTGKMPQGRMDHIVIRLHSGDIAIIIRSPARCPA